MFCRYFCCANKKTSSCTATAILEANASKDEIVLTRPHNHPPDESLVIKNLFETKLKHAVVLSDISVKDIYNNVVSS